MASCLFTALPNTTPLADLDLPQAPAAVESCITQFDPMPTVSCVFNVNAAPLVDDERSDKLRLPVLPLLTYYSP